MMNPIITEMYHELTALREGLEDQDEVKLKEKNGELYYQQALGGTLSAVIRLFCRKDWAKELSIEIYVLDRVVLDREETLRKINEQNGEKNRWFRFCLNQENEVFLKRDEDYESTRQIMQVISCGLGMAQQAVPYFAPYADETEEGRRKIDEIIA